MNETAINLTGVQSPYLAQYLGLWAMIPHVLEEAVARIATIDLKAHLERQAELRAAREEKKAPSMYAYEVTPDGVAVIDVAGTMMKAESSLGDSTSTIMLRRTIRDVRSQYRAGQVRALMARVDSPGGSIDGTEEVADELYAAAQEMPVAAHGSGMIASAAYWFSAQAPTISATATTVVGSIGTYAAIRDTSAAYAQMGVKVHVIRSADAKGAGVPGTEVTAKQLGEWQRLIDDSQAVFTAAVSRGRRIPMEKAQALADARVHVGQAAKSMGLIDYVESFDAAMNRLRQSADARQKKVGTRAVAESQASLSTLGTSGPATFAAPNVQMIISVGDSEIAYQGEPGTPAPFASAQDLLDRLREACEANNHTNDTQKQPAVGCSAGESEPTAETPGPATAPAGSEADSRKELSIMSQPNTAPAPSEPKAATMAELKAACTGAPSDFLVEQSEKGATADQAVRAYVAFQNAQIRSRDEELAKSKAAPAAPAEPAAQPAARKPGVPAVESEGRRSAKSAAGEPGADFNEAVREQMTRNGNNRQAAIKSVCKADPDLHRSYLEATNPRKVHAMIGDRFGA